MIAVIAIFDIGKTNKKFFLFNQQYQIVLEQTNQFNEINDEDGDACDDVRLLSEWVVTTLTTIIENKQYHIKAVNFSTYGASFVHINAAGKPITPLYNYLKSFPQKLKEQFYSDYGCEEKISLETASPILGHLNSGMQLYWLKYYKREVFNNIHFSLHLPQYISYLITKQAFSDITSIGCHTQLWNFEKKQYHVWVTAENIVEKLPKIFSSNDAVSVLFKNCNIQVGIGLHDSSAALIPYLKTFSEPFVLISTGTWCISLNPFNDDALTAEELQQDCLCYMEYNGNPVKASRLFAGYEHEQQTKRMANFFDTTPQYYKQVGYNEQFLLGKNTENEYNILASFDEVDLSKFSCYEEAYHYFIAYLVFLQKKSTSLILGKKSVKNIFVDGGFGNNEIYMKMLATAFPLIEIYAATVAQATALGAALAIHNSWNRYSLPQNLVQLKKYNPIPQKT